MLTRIRKHLGLGRRSRRSVIALTWLCFLMAAMPCITAWAACCPMTAADNGSQAAHQQGDHAGADAHAHHAGSDHGSHPVDPLLGDTSADLPEIHACGDSGGNCCDEALPTLEDRSPKPLPSAADAGLAVVAVFDDEADNAQACARETQATGPPAHQRSHPRTHLEHCSFLI